MANVFGKPNPLPVFRDLPDGPDALLVSLRDGFSSCQAVLLKWCETLYRNDIALPTDKRRVEWGSIKPGKPVSTSFVHEFFQVESFDQIHVGKSFPFEVFNGFEPMRTLMDACSAGLENDESAYRQGIGAANPRLASPLWVRIYQTREGFVPVLTWSPRKMDNPAMTSRVKGLVDNICNELTK